MPNLSSIKLILSRNGILLVIFLFLIFIPFVIDSYLIHRTYQYFGGGALNRPYALTSVSEYILYFCEAIMYDTFIYTILLYLLFISLSPFKKTYSQKVFLSVSFTFLIYFIYTSVSMQVLSYFGGHFDLKVLTELTEGNLLNAFSFISIKQLSLVAIILILPLICIYMAYILERTSYKNIFDSVTFTLKNNKNKYFLGFFILFIISNHFIIHNNKTISHGLSSKLSYTILHSILKIPTDFDGDGFSPLTQVKDPDNFNSNINSYAVDIPSNGIDENGLAGDFEGLNSYTKELNPPNAPLLPPSKNVIVIVIETFRTDVIDKKYQDISVMPFLSEITKKYAYTPYMYSNYGITAKAIQTIFTGKVNYTLKDNDNLFDYYRKYGYKIMGASAQSEDWGNTDKILSFSKFDDYYDPRNKKNTNEDQPDYHKMKGILATLDSKELNTQIFRMLEESAKSPFLMYINYQDLHYPYHSSSWEKKFIDKGYINSDFFSKKNRAKIMKQYSNSAYHLDQSIKALFTKLKMLSILDNTVIAIVGDHPDSFYENDVLGHAWIMDKHQRQTPYILVNGIGEYKAPFGQDEIYNMLINSSYSGEEQKATFKIDKEKKVFLIAGDLKTPRKIGFISPTILEKYDFTTGERNLNEKDFKILINYWENYTYLGSVK